jgi:hypothetical protein
MTGKDVLRTAAALLIGAAIAFPAGMMLAGRSAEPPRTAAQAVPATRQVFSPRVLSDPYFLDQQRRGIETLEARCREAGELCAEARAGRRWLQEHAL